MKKILFCIAAALMAVSCFKDVGYEATYTLLATFNYTNPDLFADDSLVINFPDESESVLPIQYGDLAFFAAADSDRKFTGGFALSTGNWDIEDWRNRSEEDMDKEIAPYCVCDSTAYGDSTYMIFHQADESLMPEHDFGFLSYAVGTCTPSGCMVNNILNALIYAESLGLEPGDGSYIMLTATGYMGEQVTGTSDFYLLDYRSGSKLDEPVTEWEYWDLSGLGNVQYVDFSIDVNYAGADAATMPDLNYFCMDNFSASIHIKQQQ